MVGLIIGKFADWFIENSQSQPRYIMRGMLQLNNVKQFCESFPTCECCPFREEHKGCMFRDKTPREW